VKHLKSCVQGAINAFSLQLTEVLTRVASVMRQSSELGRLEAFMRATDVAASFANAAYDLQKALTSIDFKGLGCDELAQKQASITQDQLRNVQAPYPEEELRALVQLRKHAETLRVQGFEELNIRHDSYAELRVLLAGFLNGYVPYGRSLDYFLSPRTCSIVVSYIGGLPSFADSNDGYSMFWFTCLHK
jgi:hypothetical protein